MSSADGVVMSLRTAMELGLYPPKSASRTVLAHGTFDLLHLGHIRHLQEARAQGDRLVVSVTADAHVQKGLGRPRFTAAERVEALKALDCVDDVFVSHEADAVSVIDRIKPAVYVKGIDYAQSHDEALAREATAVTRHGGRLHITKAEKLSSSRLINTERFPADVIAYLDKARQRGFMDRILRAFDKADALRIAFVGETIIDEYRFVSALGKASKEFVLATVETGREEFLGGVVAASRHGEWKNAEFITPPDSIRKTRFVDADFNRKLFEVYNKKTLGLHPVLQSEFDRRLAMEIDGFDVVVVTDFGHGLLGSGQRTVLEKRAKFLAVNAQSNAGNMGFNPATKWTRADLVCIDIPEASLAAMDNRPIDYVVTELHGKIDCPRFLITQGKDGSYYRDWSYYRDGDRDGHAFALASSAVDTMGAGDAVIAVAAPLIAAGLDLEAAAFVGNVAGAIKVSILGHRKHVERAELMQNIEALLA